MSCFLLDLVLYFVLTQLILSSCSYFACWCSQLLTTSFVLSRPEEADVPQATARAA
jgi:uncharacterized membrane protein